MLILVLTSGSLAAKADPITFTFSQTVSGVIGPCARQSNGCQPYGPTATTFSNRLVTLTVVTDTSKIETGGPGNRITEPYVSSSDEGIFTLSLAGFGSTVPYNIPPYGEGSDIHVQVNRQAGTVTLYQNFVYNVFFGPVSDELKDVYFNAGTGPITGFPSPLEGSSQFQRLLFPDLGTVALDFTQGGPVTFQVTLGDSTGGTVPEPNTLALLATGSFGLLTGFFPTRKAPRP